MPWRLSGEDPLGATVTLGQLLSSSKEIVKKLVNPTMIKTFRTLVRRCGPEPRLINIFTAVCFVEGRPEHANQELCLQLLWLDPWDRYGFGATFHECPGAKVVSISLSLPQRVYHLSFRCNHIPAVPTEI
jgi:hypothetical protein